MFTEKQLPQTVISPVSTTEQTKTANQLLSEARSLREQLAAESTEANRKLSEAILAVITHTEKVENTNHLLAFTDSCVGQIRSRMRAHAIPIHPPSTLSNAVAIESDTNGTAIQGQSLRLECLHDCVLMRC